MKTAQLGMRLSALLTLLALLTLAFCSCLDGRESDTAGSCKIVLQGDTAEEYTVDLSKVENLTGAVSVIDYLKTAEGLTYTMSGTFLTSIGSLNPDAGKNEYIAVYTSVERDFDVSEWSGTVEYQGKTLTSSGVGLLDMNAEDGAVILFKLASY